MAIINDLPTEIKARIVEICAEQDERYAAWEEQLRKGGRMTYTDKARRSSGARVKRTVGALFEVSKEWAALAAPALFKVLKASKIDFAFKSLVAPKYLHFFRELLFDVEQQAKLEDLLVVIPQLGKITKLVIKRRAVDSIWQYGTVSFSGPFSYYSPIAAFAGPAFRRLLNSNSVVELDFGDINCIAMSPFLLAAQVSLKTLDLQLNRNNWNEVGHLGQALSATKHLRTLNITAHEAYPRQSTFDAGPLTAAFTSFPSLEQLSLSTQYPHASHLALASNFKATLSRLSLHYLPPSWQDVVYSPYIVEQGNFTSEAFPRVSTFAFSGHVTWCCKTLASIKPRHFPSLTTLELEIEGADDFAGTKASFLYPFASFSSLVSVRVVNLTHLAPGALESLELFCDEHGIALEGSPQLALPPTATVATTTTVRGLAQRARKTLDFLEARIEEAQAADERSKLSRIQTKLQPFEEERLVAELWKAA
ncbi:hypothetical protein JCM10207_000647 [Rhodosporidiobolus poonsookiae]